MELLISLSLFAVLLLASLVGFVNLKKRHQQMQQQLQQQQTQLHNLNQQLQLVADGAFGLGQQLAGVESNIKTHNTAPQDNSPTGDISLRQSIELARKGATVDELIEICGLARGEAELLSTMHKQQDS